MSSWVSSAARRAALLCLVVAGAALGGCATAYVDGGLKEADPASFKPVEPRHAAQLLLEFQSKGVANAVATAHVKPRVIATVQDSRLFTAVSEAADPSAGLLAITINNVPTDDNAFAKGFASGLTFGLVGTQVSDGYVCTVRYTPPGGQPIVTTMRHAIHTSIGTGGPPPNAVKADNLNAAVDLMIRQIVGQSMLALSRDPAFR